MHNEEDVRPSAYFISETSHKTSSAKQIPLGEFYLFGLY